MFKNPKRLQWFPIWYLMLKCSGLLETINLLQSTIQSNYYSQNDKLSNWNCFFFCYNSQPFFLVYLLLEPQLIQILIDIELIHSSISVLQMFSNDLNYSVSLTYVSFYIKKIKNGHHKILNKMIQKIQNCLKISFGLAEGSKICFLRRAKHL